MQRFIAMSLAILMFVLAVADVDGAEPRQTAEKLDGQVRVELSYLLYLPPDYAKQNSWPLLLFLHGAGERGDDLKLVKTHGPPKLIDQGKDFPLVIVSPQSPKQRSWQAHELTALLDEIVTRHKIDKDRIYVSGLSMGGFGTWALAAYTPERFAAIVPICGGGEAFAARRLTNVPVWAFHGAKDQVVPLKRSEDMVEAVKKSQGDAKLTVYPDAGHDSWTATYENPEVYTWLLQHKRKSAEKNGP